MGKKREKQQIMKRGSIYTLKYFFTSYLLSKPQNILFESHFNTLLSQRTLLTPHNILKLILENFKKNRKIKNEFRICKSRMFGYIQILKSENLPMIRKFKSGESLLYRKCKSENVQIIRISKSEKLLLRPDFKIRK